MNYEEMSDFEINRRVAEARGFPLFSLQSASIKLNRRAVVIKGVDSNKEVDFCNNPSDAWPIIVENKISIGFRSDIPKIKPIAYWGDDHMYWVDENPLRAAMIVYLMMEEAKNEVA